MEPTTAAGGASEAPATNWSPTANQTNGGYYYSGNDTEAPFMQHFLDNLSFRKFDLITQNILIAMYCVLICIGAFGNSLVCIAVIRKPAMRTARNLFIINLAVSDLTLCIFTMPFTLMQNVLKNWPLGEFMCKLVCTFEATNVFVSTMSITAIALDRYQVIVYPTTQSSQKLGGILILGSLWGVSIILAMPMFLYHAKHPMGLPDLVFYYVCAESVWPVPNGPFVYAVCAVGFQYVMPIAVTTAAYGSICRKLQYRMVSQTTMHNQRKKELEGRRKKKTNQLLIAIAAIFAISWLPLNIFNLVTFWDTQSTMLSPGDANLIFAVCHMMGMSSACSNPLLYGWLNDNFRKEFNEILCNCSELNIMDKISGSLRRGGATTGVGGEEVPVVVYTKAPTTHLAAPNSAANAEPSGVTQVEQLTVAV
ncbi:PREDICTED: neuropeptide F receptor-like [Priapulus caudatus]|uniref:Neuropeptide F receptor-like n=1 Tax=Priapulus caudatus TaxID=37621 RepID=A0ABM1E429_PRICU|nr:PREDICTED: neuropeptide F receptor-like [Priapulus caudatus]